ncbi:hypothetical protein [Actinokineospora sp. NBRC 105648]|uniref:hypothetical protein n=1 Tax=Actinokineospora sp. NBRC 105648 TaxID=3032206 RepID=UPI0024A1FFEB|nr:hypothetical protein [Actinokineospora sp. NBRC 105648]GLZ41980.1 hypothetical protein Acsp05_56040 [Actinokineospora sp. NBRC 105648]
MTTLTALEEVVDRHGRATLADPIALTGALRSLATPPPDADIADLAGVSASGAVERLRAAVEAGARPQEARAEALRGTTGDRAEWAVDQLGAALGYLPRGAEPVAKQSNSNRTLLIAALVVVLLGAVGTVVVFSANRDTASGPVEPTAAAPTTTVAPTTTTTPPTSSTTNTSSATTPRAAFTDPALLKVAEPYLDRAGVKCEVADPQVGVQESVLCDLGSGIAASFRKLLDPQQLDALRGVLINDNPSALPGSVRSLRWEYVPGKPGIRTGIPVGTPRKGDGARVRFLDPEHQLSRLYFDEDATGVAVLMQATTDDQQVLRAFWADPDA